MIIVGWFIDSTFRSIVSLILHAMERTYWNKNCDTRIVSTWSFDHILHVNLIFLMNKSSDIGNRFAVAIRGRKRDRVSLLGLTRQLRGIMCTWAQYYYRVRASRKTGVQIYYSTWSHDSVCDSFPSGWKPQLVNRADAIRYSWWDGRNKIKKYRARIIFFN